MIMNGLSQGGGSDSRIPVIYTTSYVGTGTYGVNNPNTLTFDFVPEIVILYKYSFPKLFSYSTGVFPQYYFTNYQSAGYYRNTSFDTIIITQDLTTSYKPCTGFYSGYKSESDVTDYNTIGSYAKKSSDGKTIYWYNTQGSAFQCNVSNIQSGGSNTNKPMTYYILAIGYKEES